MEGERGLVALTIVIYPPSSTTTAIHGFPGTGPHAIGLRPETVTLLKSSPVSTSKMYNLSVPRSEPINPILPSELIAGRPIA
jgi:hypothetical protein